MLVRRALGDPDDDKFFKDALEFFLAYYREHKLDHTVVYEGIFEALQQIRRRCARCMLLSREPFKDRQLSRMIASLASQDR